MKEEELLTAEKPTPITRDVHTGVDYCTRRRTSQRQQTSSKRLADIELASSKHRASSSN